MNNFFVFLTSLSYIFGESNELSVYDIVSEMDKNLNSNNRVLTSEMIIKSVKMRIPIVISRSGFTASGVELARRANLTLIGRAKGKRFTVLSGEKRIR